MPHGIMRALPAHGVIIPRYLCDTNKATELLRCLPAARLPASCWHAGARPSEGGSTSASSQSGRTPRKSGQHLPQGIEQPQGPGVTHVDLPRLQDRDVPATHPLAGGGGRALTSWAVCKECRQCCPVGTGTHCFWWPQARSCLSTRCHRQAQRAASQASTPQAHRQHRICSAPSAWHEDTWREDGAGLCKVSLSPKPPLGST